MSNHPAMNRAPNPDMTWIPGESPPAPIRLFAQMVSRSRKMPKALPVPNWEAGAVGGGSFIVATMSPQQAQAYMPLMKNLGRR